MVTKNEIKLNRKKLIRNTRIKKYSVFSYFLMRVIYFMIQAIKVLYPVLIFFILILLPNYYGIFKEGSEMLDINSAITFYSIALTFFAISIALISIIFSRKDEQLFDKSIINMVFTFNNGYGHTVSSSFILSLLFSFLGLTAIFNLNPKWLIENSFYIIIFSLIICLSAFRFIKLNINEFYYKYLNDYNWLKKYPRFLSKYRNYPNLMSFFNNLDNEKPEVRDEFMKSKYAQYIFNTLYIVLEKNKFGDTTDLEDNNLVYFLEKYINDINDQSELFLLSIILETISDINKQLIVRNKVGIFYKLNNNILEKLKKLPRKKFMVNFNKVIVEEESIINAFYYHLSAKNNLNFFDSKVLNGVFDYKKYKIINSILLNRILETYIAQLKVLINGDNKFQDLLNLIDEVGLNLVDQSIVKENSNLENGIEKIHNILIPIIEKKL